MNETTLIHYDHLKSIFYPDFLSFHLMSLLSDFFSPVLGLVILAHALFLELIVFIYSSVSYPLFIIWSEQPWVSLWLWYITATDSLSLSRDNVHSIYCPFLIPVAKSTQRCRLPQTDKSHTWRRNPKIREGTFMYRIAYTTELSL